MQIWSTFVKKKPGPLYLFGISATRLSLGDPLGFPSHSREWFSIIVYPILIFPIVAIISQGTIETYVMDVT